MHSCIVVTQMEVWLSLIHSEATCADTLKKLNTAFFTVTTISQELLEKFSIVATF